MPGRCSLHRAMGLVLLVIFVSASASAEPEVPGRVVVGDEPRLERLGAFDEARFTLRLTNAAPEGGAFRVFLSFKERKSSEPMIEAQVFDEACTGEYDLSLMYKPSKRDQLYHNVAKLVAWSKPLDVSVRLLSKRLYEVRIGESRFEIPTLRSIKWLEVKVMHGAATLEDFYVK